MIVGLLLAAGAGRRFGGNKLLANLGDGRCVAEQSCARLRPAVDRLIAIVRPDATALSERLSAAGAEVYVCPNADEGMGASLSFGVRQTPDADGWLIGLADMPCVSSADSRRVAEALRAGAGIALPIAQDADGRPVRGHPVGFSHRFLADLSALSGDAGARALLEKYAADIVTLPVDDVRTWQDVDTTADLEAVKTIRRQERETR
jgi:molybdenum cofactor cytidylyltransferase